MGFGLREVPQPTLCRAPISVAPCSWPNGLIIPTDPRAPEKQPQVPVPCRPSCPHLLSCNRHSKYWATGQVDYLQKLLGMGP